MFGPGATLFPKMRSGRPNVGEIFGVEVSKILSFKERKELPPVWIVCCVVKDVVISKEIWEVKTEKNVKIN